MIQRFFSSKHFSELISFEYKARIDIMGETRISFFLMSKVEGQVLFQTPKTALVTRHLRRSRGSTPKDQIKKITFKSCNYDQLRSLRTPWIREEVKV